MELNPALCVDTVSEIFVKVRKRFVENSNGQLCAPPQNHYRIDLVSLIQTLGVVIYITVELE